VRGRFAGYRQAEREVVARADRLLVDRREGRHRDAATVSAVAEALRQLSQVTRDTDRRSFAALAETLDGDSSAARRLVASSIRSHLHPPRAWGAVAAVLAADTGRQPLLVDWAIRLGDSRVDDAEAHLWASETLASLDHLVPAVDLVVRHPHPDIDRWIDLAVRLADLADLNEEVGMWSAQWASTGATALDEPTTVDPDVLATLATVLDPGQARAVVGLLLERLEQRAGLADRVAIGLWRLAELSGDVRTAGRAFRAVAETRLGRKVEAGEYQALVYQYVDVLEARDMTRFAALVFEAMWRESHEISQGFAAVYLWRRANEPARERAVLLDAVNQVDATAVAALAPEARASIGRTAAVTLLGDVTETERLEALDRLDGAGIPMPGQLELPTGLSMTALREQNVRIQLTTLLRSGRVDEARAVALHASFVDRVGSPPAGLIVDALLEGGAHGEAYQLARALTRVYPDDMDALRRLCSAAVWYGRQGEAVDLARQALLTKPQSIGVLADSVRWLANVDHEAALRAVEGALSDPRNALVAEQLRALLDELSSIR
jgi:hypothetical protein